jgi:hypothetical protein
MLLMTAKTAARVEAAGNDLGDVCALLSAHRRGQRLTPRREALARARHTIASNPAIAGLQLLVWNGDDSIELVKVGPRGGVKRIARIWDRFGNPV